MPEQGLAATFIAALQALDDWLEDEQIPYTTIGGVAVSLLAQPRATQDIDIVIWLEEGRWDAFLRAGESYGFEPRISDAVAFAAKSRVLLLRHRESGISIDISCGALPFEREMIERATMLNIGRLRLRVPTPEDLIITKGVAQRPKDIADIETILNVHQSIDLARIRHWIQEFAAALEMPELLENLERLLQHQSQAKSRHSRNTPQ